MPIAFFTIGHSTHCIDEFVEALRNGGDLEFGPTIRPMPWSRPYRACVHVLIDRLYERAYAKIHFRPLQSVG